MKKKLEINNRGIILWEDGEVLNQGLYSEKKDILYEVYEVISVIDEVGEIELDINIELEEEIIESLKDLITNKKGVIKEKKQTVSRRFKSVIIAVISIELLIGFLFFIKISKAEKEIDTIKKEGKILNQKLEENSETIKNIKKEDKIEYRFLKNNIGELLLFFSNVFYKKGYINSLEISDKKIIINGFSKGLKDIIEIKKRVEGYKRIKESKLDYIKKEGEDLFYSIELKIE